MQRDLPTPASALAIAAHPDDVEFGCGATLAKCTRNAAEGPRTFGSASRPNKKR